MFLTTSIQRESLIIIGLITSGENQFPIMCYEMNSFTLPAGLLTADRVIHVVILDIIINYIRDLLRGVISAQRVNCHIGHDIHVRVHSLGEDNQ